MSLISQAKGPAKNTFNVDNTNYVVAENTKTIKIWKLSSHYTR